MLLMQQQQNELLFKVLSLVPRALDATIHAVIHSCNLPALMQYPTKQEATWLLTHPSALDHDPMQILFLDELPSVKCYQTTCMPPGPPMPLLGCIHTLTPTSYHTQTPILPPSLIHMVASPVAPS